MRHIVRRLKSGVRVGVRTSVRFILANAVLRRGLNHAYGLLGDGARTRFHSLTSTLYRDPGRDLLVGSWSVQFAGKRLLLPLTPERSWLEWDTAVSIVGHDLDVKRTYESLIRSRPPKVFFDIGGNYGTHSLLLLLHGVRTVTFEPNTSCHSYFQQACQLNDLDGDVQGVAIADVEGVATLRFPSHDTWLGTLDTAIANGMREKGELMAVPACIDPCGVIERWDEPPVP